MACNKIKDVEQHKYQSTTLTALAIHKNQYFGLHVGDGALYHFSNSSQSVSSITPIASQNETTIFIEPDTVGHMRVYRYTGRIDSGDVLLLTTDGLHHLWGNSLADKLKELCLRLDDTSDIVDFLFEKRKYVNRHDDLTCFVVKCLPYDCNH